jgi:glycosyltransferase involved in cell wall biosynthesis
MLPERATTMPQALDILRSDETLLFAFALRHAAGSGASAYTDENAARFLLWFALEGRESYHHARFGPQYVAFLAQPRPPFVSRLAAYVLMRRADIRQKFGKDPDAFHAWYYHDGVVELGLGVFVTPREQRFLAEAHPRFAGRPAPLSRREYYAYLRDPEAQAKFDLTDAEHRERFLAFLALQDSETALPWFSTISRVDNAALPGVNVIGFAEAVLGIGEDARALLAALGAADIMRSVYRVELPDSHATNDRYAHAALSVTRPVFPVNVFALTSFETARLKIEQGANLFEGRYNIGYWPWELTSLPPEWHGVFDLVDEIWASSEFLLDVYSRLTAKPVHLVPPYLNVPTVENVDLGQFGIGKDDITFLTMFDFNSYVARKNPLASIRAFRLAFPDASGPERMIVKTLNGHAHIGKLKEIEEAIGNDDRFVLIDGPFSRAEVCGLIAAVDCFVSLHRSEGFGRVIAEAMLLKTAVVATNWSGNTTFLEPGSGYLVDHTLRDVLPGEYVFAEGSQWAEPSLDDAVAKLRLARVAAGSDAAMRDKAREAVEERYSLDAAGRAITARLEAIAPACTAGILRRTA